MPYKGFVIRYKTDDGSDHMVVADDENLPDKIMIIMGWKKVKLVEIVPHKTKMDAIQELSR